MRKVLIAYSTYYGGSCEMKREYNSRKEFERDVRMYGEFDYELVAVELANDEEYYVTEYDGMESLGFRKIVQPKLKSKVRARLMIDRPKPIKKETSCTITHEVEIHNLIVERFTTRPEYLEIALEQTCIEAHLSPFDLRERY